jgi:apolipoprotein N-acyltransferase
LNSTPRAGTRWHVPAGLVASALLLALFALAPAGWPLGFLALAPWLAVLDEARNLRVALLLGLAMSVLCVLAVFTWFGMAIGNFTGLGPWAGMGVLVAAAPVLQPQFLTFALVRHAVARRHGRPLAAWAAAAAWVATEAFWPKLLGDTLGHGLHAAAALRQAADLGGAAGLTLMLLLVNEALVAGVRRRGQGLRRVLMPPAAALALVATVAGYGLWKLDRLRAPVADAAPTLRIAMVQANQTDYERRRREEGAYAVVREVLDTHYALSVSAIRDHGADALLWSETIYPTTFGHPRSTDGAALDAEIQGFVEATGVPLVFGSYDLDTAGEYNAAVFLEPGRGRLGTYRKTHPFPLTEWVPGWLDGPAFRRLLPWAGGWQPGDGARVFPLRTRDGREVNVVPLICLDDVHPHMAIDGARLGAQAIVGLSNDAWFTDHPNGARLHLAVAAFRSVETGLPQVRVTTNGLSAVIDETGDVLVSTAMGQQAVLTGYVSARDPAPTVMVRWGDWVGRAAAAFLIALAVYALWRGARRHAAQHPRPIGPQRIVVGGRRLRIAQAALRLLAAFGLGVLAYGMATRIGWQVATLTQLIQFGTLVVLPLLLAWGLGRAASARALVEGDTLVFEGRRERTEIALSAIEALQAWRLPLPGPGADLRLRSGRRWSMSGTGIARLRHALEQAGALPTSGDGSRSMRTLTAFHDQRASAHQRWLDHGLVKFGLFPLLPALIAFRLHQVIAFGGTFGEWLTFGPTAWLSGLAIWWGAWSLGLMLFAALLRVLVEALALPLALLRPHAAMDTRDGLEWLGRLVFYLGVPAALVVRLLSG